MSGQQIDTLIASFMNPELPTSDSTINGLYCNCLYKIVKQMSWKTDIAKVGVYKFVGLDIVGV